jgi:hypothetical protein
MDESPLNGQTFPGYQNSLPGRESGGHWQIYSRTLCPGTNQFIKMNDGRGTGLQVFSLKIRAAVAA